LRVDAEIHLVSEIARLRISIGREAVAVDKALNDHPSRADDRSPRWGAAEHKELSRQLDALRQHVARASSRSQDRLELRAELATLLPFAKTLRVDAQNWRAGLEDGLKELEQKEAAARAERERLAAERERLLRQRDALQSAIHEAAGRVAEKKGGECRNTLPVYSLGQALTVCSVVVLSPRRWLLSKPDWLVTLNDSRSQVRVTRSY
jgi:chromosome segregation ATPase